MMTMDRTMLVSVAVLIAVPLVFVSIAAVWQYRWTSKGRGTSQRSTDAAE